MEGTKVSRCSHQIIRHCSFQVLYCVEYGHRKHKLRAHFSVDRFPEGVETSSAFYTFSLSTNSTGFVSTNSGFTFESQFNILSQLFSHRSAARPNSSSPAARTNQPLFWHPSAAVKQLLKPVRLQLSARLSGLHRVPIRPPCWLHRTAEEGETSWCQRQRRENTGRLSGAVVSTVTARVQGSNLPVGLCRCSPGACVGFLGMLGSSHSGKTLR